MRAYGGKKYKWQWSDKKSLSESKKSMVRNSKQYIRRKNKSHYILNNTMDI